MYIQNFKEFLLLHNKNDLQMKCFSKSMESKFGLTFSFCFFSLGVINSHRPQWAPLS